MRKNVASQIVGAQMVSASDGSAFTGSVTVAVTIDGGTQATGSVGSGACTHEGGGYHTYAPSQAETNGNLLAFTFSGAGAIPVTVQIYTTSLNPHDTVRGGLTALPNAAADAAGGLPISDAGGLDLDTLLARLDAAISTRATVSAILTAFGATTGAVEDHASNSTTQFQSDLAETADDYFNGSVVAFTSGTNSGQARRITDYVGSSGTLTVSPAFDAEPDAADAFIVLGRID